MSEVREIECPTCKAPYKPWDKPLPKFMRDGGYGIDRLPMLTTCDCHKKEQERQDQAVIDEEFAVRFRRLNLGDVDEFMLAPSAAITEGVFSNSEEAIKRGCSLILWGGVGNGKTTRLKRLAYGCTQMRLRVRGGKTAIVCKFLKDNFAFKQFHPDVESYMAYIMQGDVLVLDDLDKMLGTAYELQELLTFVDFYKVNNKPVLITMNSSLAVFKETLLSNRFNLDMTTVAALMDRFIQNAQVLEVKNPSFRDYAKEFKA